MAGQVVIPNVFAAQTGPLPLAQLDADFVVLRDSLNNVGTFSNYYVDASGSPNSIVVTVNSPTTFSYANGASLSVKIANTNTGATQINVNGLGAKNVTTTSLSPLTAGQIVANAVVTLIYDGTQFQVQNPSIAAVGAGGSNTQIQYNSGGAFAGATMTFDNVTRRFAIAAPASGAALTVSGASGGNVLVAVVNGSAFGLTVSSSAGQFSGIQFSQASQQAAVIYQPALSDTLVLQTAGVDRLTVGATGTITVAAPTSGVTLSVYEPLNSINAQKTAATYDTGSFTGTLTGCTTSPTATFNWSRNGNAVVIDCQAGLTGTSNSGSLTFTGVPAALNAARNSGSTVEMVNNGVYECGTAIVTGGAIIVRRLGFAAFTSSGLKGISLGFTLTYNLT